MNYVLGVQEDACEDIRVWRMIFQDDKSVKYQKFFFTTIASFGVDQNGFLWIIGGNLPRYEEEFLGLPK